MSIRPSIAKSFTATAAALALVHALLLPMAVSAAGAADYGNVGGRTIPGPTPSIPCDPGDIFGCDKINPQTGNQSPRVIANRIIQFAMSFLGLIAVAIILYGGFKWMTAAGNDEKVDEAKKLIGAGIVGLIIIVAAYSIVTFVIGNLLGFARDSA